MQNYAILSNKRQRKEYGGNTFDAVADPAGVVPGATGLQKSRKYDFGGVAEDVHISLQKEAGTILPYCDLIDCLPEEHAEYSPPCQHNSSLSGYLN